MKTDGKLLTNISPPHLRLLSKNNETIKKFVTDYMTSLRRKQIILIDLENIFDKFHHSFLKISRQMKT